MKSRIVRACGILLAYSTLSAAQLQSAPAGFHRCDHFSAPVQAEWRADGRTMKLIRPLTYLDPECKDWTAPAGSVIDGASIPRFFWSVTGGPFEGKYRDASVIHDVECSTRNHEWQAVHFMFYRAMLANGVGRIKAELMYQAVYWFGPSWITKEEEERRAKEQEASAKEFERQVAECREHPVPQKMHGDNCGMPF